jgi:hypothetical protein
MKRRTGADTCCFKCQRRARCESFPAKTRVSCTCGPPESESCLRAQKGRDKFCLVCDDFVGGPRPEDPNQGKLFGGPATRL